MKRYQIVIQHEVIMYAESAQQAQDNLLETPFVKARTNPQCISVTEIPMPESEQQAPLIDERRAPGT
jgi:hypothetical protein